MPVFDLKCLGCGEITEFFISNSKEVLPSKCNCGGKLEKAPALSSFHLKGGGWYKDGYSSQKT